MISPLDRAGRLIRTVSHLQPAQVGHRVRLRTQKIALERWGGRLRAHMARRVPAAWGWPAGFAPLDATIAEEAPSAEANADGTFRFLAETRHLGKPPDWRQRDAAQLWRYHLHYFEWVWAFTRSQNRDSARLEFERAYRSWKAGTRFGRWDEWSPYVVALRTWVLCGVYDALVAGSHWEQEFVSDVALHAGFVLSNLEFDVGGNHLVKNLKALIGSGLWLADDGLLTRGSELLQEQIRIQVLADGGHFERSPSYHAQVLGDLIDIAGLLDAARRPPIRGLGEAIVAMRSWLEAMVGPDGTVPLFNDCVPVPPERLTALGVTPAPPSPLTLLEASGYVVARAGRWHMVADVGLPCPPGLPAHAHADTLSFVAWLDAEAVIVDTGISEYGSGPRRAYERSTAAHNTVELDGHDSTEVWGGFRAGRRARPTLEEASASPTCVTIAASHDGYRHLPGRPVHRRRWHATPEGIDVIDEVTGGSRHAAVARLHLRSDRVTVRSDAAISSVAPADPPLGLVGDDFGMLGPARCIEAREEGTLPLRWWTSIRAAAVANDGPVYHPPS